MEPHTYVIHLKHRKDRKKQFIDAWTNATLSTDHLHWFPAVLGTSLSDAKLANFRTAARTRKARAGRVGCFCSHVAALERAVRLNHFPLLILEDDAIPFSGTQPDIAALFDSAPPSANLLYFGALPVRERKPVKTFCRSRNGWSTPPSDIQLYGGHAYGFPSVEAGASVLSFLKENKMTFDSALIRYTKENRSHVAVHCPFIFHQSEGYSDIEATTRPPR